MIFKRLSRAVLGRDWSVVAVDILVVVIGIFLGLQADGWNEAEILRNYPGLTQEDLRACLAYAKEAAGHLPR